MCKASYLEIYSRLSLLATYIYMGTVSNKIESLPFFSFLF